MHPPRINFPQADAASKSQKVPPVIGTKCSNDLRTEVTHLVRKQTSAQATLLDGFPALRERGTAAPPSFMPMSIVATVVHLIYC